MPKTTIIEDKVHTKLRQIKFFKDHKSYSETIQYLIDTERKIQRMYLNTNYSQYFIQFI